MLEAGPCFADQYIYVEGRPGKGSAPVEQPGAPGKSGSQSNGKSGRRAASDSSAELPPALSRFGQEHRRRLEHWTNRIAQLRQNRTRVALWGTGGRGICFLNTVENADLFSTVVDVNPQRQGRHIPGTGQRIVAPEHLTKHPVDLIVLTNPLYEQEIREQVSQLGLDCQFEVI